MNRITVAVISLIASLALGIASLMYVKNTCTLMITEVDGILDNAYAQNTQEVNRLAVLANTHWEKKKFFMNILVGQNDTLPIKADLLKILDFAQHNDLESVCVYAEECKAELNRIIQSNEPSLSTIL